MSGSSRTLTACALMLTVGIAAPAFAQSTDTTRTARPPMREGMMGPRAEMRSRMRSDNADGPRRDAVRRDRGPGMRGGRDRAPGRGVGLRGPDGPRGLLRGITLSTDQEKALRANQARHLLSTKPLMLEMMSARTDEQLARLNGDQKALGAASARLSTSRTRLDSLRSTRSSTTELRAVLTPEQQTLLDRNLSSPGFRRSGPRGAAGSPGARSGRDPAPRRGIERPSRPRSDSLDDSATSTGDR